MWNKILKPDLKEGIDYEILDFDSWSLISNKYFLFIYIFFHQKICYLTYNIKGFIYLGWIKTY